MRTFLTLISVVGCYGGFAMVAVYFAAELFVMRNAQLQEFILLNGPEMIYGPILFCLCAEWCKDRLEESPVPGQDSLAAGIIGTISFLGATWAYLVPQVQVLSGAKFALLVGIAMFAWAMSLVFFLKEEAS